MSKKTRTPLLCSCQTCQQLDRSFPNEGRQFAMFAALSDRKTRKSPAKASD